MREVEREVDKVLPGVGDEWRKGEGVSPGRASRLNEVEVPPVEGV
jgi:hypothetical protein